LELVLDIGGTFGVVIAVGVVSSEVAGRFEALEFPSESPAPQAGKV